MARLNRLNSDLLSHMVQMYLKRASHLPHHLHLDQSPTPEEGGRGNNSLPITVIVPSVTKIVIVHITLN